MLWVHDGLNTAAIPLLISLIEYGYTNSEITILEGIFHSAWYKPLFEQAVRIFHEENIYAYYYDLPFEETLKRHETKDNRFDFVEYHNLKGDWQNAYRNKNRWNLVSWFQYCIL